MRSEPQDIGLAFDVLTPKLHAVSDSIWQHYF